MDRAASLGRQRGRQYRPSGPCRSANQAPVADARQPSTRSCRLGRWPSIGEPISPSPSESDPVRGMNLLLSATQIRPHGILERIDPDMAPEIVEEDVQRNRHILVAVVGENMWRHHKIGHTCQSGDAGGRGSGLKTSIIASERWPARKRSESASQFLADERPTLTIPVLRPAKTLPLWPALSPESWHAPDPGFHVVRPLHATGQD